MDETARAPVHSFATVGRFQDMDAGGVLFFPRFFALFHDANLDFLAARGIDFPAALAGQRWLAPIVHAEADLKAPVRFGDALVVELTAVTLGQTSLTIDYLLRGAGEGEAVRATGRTVQVFIDPATFQKRSVPADVRAALAPGPG